MRSTIGMLSAIFMCAVNGAADEGYKGALDYEGYCQTLQQTAGLEQYSGNAILCDVKLKGLFPVAKIIESDLTKIRKAIKRSREKAAYAEFTIEGLDYLIESPQFDRFPNLEKMTVIEAVRDPQLFFTPEVGLQGGRYWYDDGLGKKSFIIQRKYPFVIATLTQAKRALNIPDNVNGNKLIEKAEAIASLPLYPDLTPEERIKALLMPDLVRESQGAAYRYIIKHSEEIKAWESTEILSLKAVEEVKESESPKKSESWVAGVSWKSGQDKKRKSVSTYRRAIQADSDAFFEKSCFSGRGEPSSIKTQPKAKAIG